MKRFSFSLILMGTLVLRASAALAASDDVPTIDSFIGCWMTAAPAPIVILGTGNKADAYQVFKEDMLLMLDRIEQTELVKGRYYAFTADLKSVIGPQYVDRAFNSAEGVLTVGEPKGGLNRVHLLSADQILYVHTKAAQTADMSVRTLERLNCETAEAKAQELKAAQK